MAKMTVTGLDEFEAKLSKLSNGGTVKAAKMAVYDGAEVLVDKVRENCEQLQTISNVEALQRYKKGLPAILTKEQKAGLLNSLGVAPMQSFSNEINTRIGFDGVGGDRGYNEITTKRWPRGQPNVMIARAVESGTSFMEKQPFVRRAVTSVKSKAQNKMKETFEREIENIGG